MESTFLLLNATFTVYILLLHTPRNAEEQRHGPWSSRYGPSEHCRTSIAVTYLQGERRTAEVWEQSRAALRTAGSCLIAKGTSITGRSSKRRIWNISYVSRSSENYISCIWPWELKTEATASLPAESELCRRSSARPAPPVAAAPELTDRCPPEARRAAESCELRPGRPAPRAAPQAPAGRRGRPPCRSPTRSSLLGGAFQTRCWRPPPPRLSGSSAAPQCGIRDGRRSRLPALSCRLPRAPWVGRKSRSAGTASSCRRRSATTAGLSSRSSAATRMPRAGAGARTAWLVRPGAGRGLR